VISKISALHEVKYEIEGVSVLEGEVDVDDKRTVELREEDPLVYNALDAFLGHYSTLILKYIDFNISFIAY